MAEKTPVSKSGMSADWFLRGALTRIGDTFDRFTGRRWVPSSSLATSELIERMKRLLDSEAKEVSGKGLVVPHNIKLKMQWDKFSADAEDALGKLQNELLAAAADHINDSLYYTYAPLNVEVKPDYFTQGVKLYVSYDQFAEEQPEAEMNVTMAGISLGPAVAPEIATGNGGHSSVYIVRFELGGAQKQKKLAIAAGKRVSIGRTANNDLVIDDVSVSKIHAAFAVDGEGHLTVADTGSTNGTFINGERIAYGKASRISEDDKLKFGTVSVSLERADPIPRPENELDLGQQIEPKVAIDGFEFSSRRSDADGLPEQPSIDEDTAKIEEKEMPDSSSNVTEENPLTPGPTPGAENK